MTFAPTTRLHSQSAYLHMCVSPADPVCFKSRERPIRKTAYPHHLRLSPAIASAPSTRPFGTRLLGRHRWSACFAVVLCAFCADPIADRIRTLVSDALHYAPERCTVIAMYGHLVVGVAFLSSPQEAYITYLAVRAGWENAQIATYVAFPSCADDNPDSPRTSQDDVVPSHRAPSTSGHHPPRFCEQSGNGASSSVLVRVCLHVYTDDHRQLLYNRFGFKAEEFIAGFYEAYLDTHSRASKNAFRLRLRR
jgi:hypothetical protein